MIDLTPQDWTAYNLSGVAGVQSPDNRESPGALWLLDVRDAVANWWVEATEERRGTVEAGDDDWWHEATHRLADESIPIATYHLWQVFTDLCLWQDEAADDIPVLTESGPHAAVVDMTAQATSILYEVAHRLTWVILTALTNDAEEAA
jgi:hypothetical protein